MQSVIGGAGIFAVCLVGGVSLPDLAHATTVTPGSLISLGDADQLEAWLGVGDQDFTRIFSGAARVATAAAFHAAADGAGPTFTVYDIQLGGGESALIGGYTSLDWGGALSYATDLTAFIFNLTSGEVQFTQFSSLYSIYRRPDYFATFGGGHDIYVGEGILGTSYGVMGTTYDGYSYSYSYDQDQGQITVAGDTGGAAGDSGLPWDHWRVRSMDVYTIAPVVPPVAAVPLPAALPLLTAAFGLLALVGRRRRS